MSALPCHRAAIFSSLDRAARHRRPAPCPCAAILAAPLPSPLRPVAHKSRYLQAVAIRRLFARMGIDSVTVRCPADDSALTIHHPWHRTGSRRAAVRDHLAAIILAAYPDMGGPSPRPSQFAQFWEDRRFYVFPKWIDRRQ